MIAANELRIGNYIKDRGGKVLKIDWFEKNKACCQNMFMGQEVHPLTEDFGYMDPIPLTPEILERCGFIEEDIFYQMGRGGVFVAEKSKGYLTINERRYKVFPVNETFVLVLFFDKGFELASFDYLHQLQNLIFALTGKELPFLI